VGSLLESSLVQLLAGGGKPATSVLRPLNQVVGQSEHNDRMFTSAGLIQGGLHKLGGWTYIAVAGVVQGAACTHDSHCPVVTDLAQPEADGGAEEAEKATSEVLRSSPGSKTGGERDDTGSLEYVVLHQALSRLGYKVIERVRRPLGSNDLRGSCFCRNMVQTIFRG
jgi:hypothetical protein